MSGQYLALGEAISDALTSFAAAEIGEANDVDQLVRATALWVEDIAYTLSRVAGRLDETAIRRDVPDAFDQTAAWAKAAAGDLAPLQHFTITGHR